VPKILFDTGAIVVSIHLHKKQNSALYYQRRIPVNLKSHYGNKNRILESLRTCSSAPSTHQRVIYVDELESPLPMSLKD
jgi:hypothetical protein